MLSVVCGVFAMTPITFGIAGYVLVSRDGAGRTPPSRLSCQSQPKMLTRKLIEIERTADHD